MKKPPQNETLEQEAIRYENQRHAYRVREIKALSARLKALQTYLPDLRAAGVNLHGGSITVLGGQKALRLFDGFFNRTRVLTTLEVLKRHGFKEIKCEAHSSYTDIVLGKGHLHIHLSLDKTREEMGKAA